MNYVPLTQDERTHEIKKLGESVLTAVQDLLTFLIISVCGGSFVFGCHVDFAGIVMIRNDVLCSALPLGLRPLTFP